MTDNMEAINKALGHRAEHDAEFKIALEKYFASFEGDNVLACYAVVRLVSMITGDVDTLKNGMGLFVADTVGRPVSIAILPSDGKELVEGEAVPVDTVH